MLLCMIGRPSRHAAWQGRRLLCHIRLVQIKWSRWDSSRVFLIDAILVFYSDFQHIVDVHKNAKENKNKKQKVKPWSQDWLIAARAYPGFCSMKRPGVFLLPLDGMLLHRRSLPNNLLGFPNNLPVPIYTPGWREALWEWSVLPKNTTQCPRPGLEPRPLDLETSALTMRPPHLPLHRNATGFWN